jgi:hypothetical protein
MSRMNMIRNLATSGLGSAGVGAAVGGAGAYYSGGDVGAGMKSGAMMGAGARIGAKGLAMGAGMSRLGIKKAMPSMMSNLNKIGMKGLARTSSAMYSPLKSGYKALNKVGSVRAGLAGGAGSLAYATLASNQGKTFAQSSLSERQSYLKNVREMQMNYNMQEATMKKQIWQGA